MGNMAFYGMQTVINALLLFSFPPDNFRQLSIRGEDKNGIALRSSLDNSSALSTGQSNGTMGLNYTYINLLINEAIFGVSDWWSGANDIINGKRRMEDADRQNVVNLDEWISPKTKFSIDTICEDLRKSVIKLSCICGRQLHEVPGGAFLMYHLVSFAPTNSTWDDIADSFQEATIFGSSCDGYNAENTQAVGVKTAEATQEPSVTTQKTTIISDEDEDKENRLYKRHSVRIRK